MTSFAEEWAQLKAEASVGSEMRLASAGGNSDGGGSGWLKADKAAWTKAANSVVLLKDGIKKAKTALEEGQNGDGPASESGCMVMSAGAQREVYQSWKNYLTDVSGRCGKLSGLLEKAGNDENRNDDAIKGAFAQLKDEYEDTAATGGQNRGR